jgi:hypothetical protein
MKKIFALMAGFVFAASASAIEISGIDMPDRFPKLESTLELKGAGVRNKFFMDLYAAGLYVGKKDSTAEEIMAADEPMAIRIHILSSLISSEKMTEATVDGFHKSTGGNLGDIKAPMESFIEAFSEEIFKGDIYDIVYTPKVGVTVYKNGDKKAVAEGLNFKSALFGIWISKDPVQEDMRDGMLGQSK